jgi:glutamate--cysteine ligase
MTDFQSSLHVTPIESVEQLVEGFHAGAKPRGAWRIGTEYEKLAVDSRTGRAIPFSGEGGIESILCRLVERFGWEPKEEAGRTISLKRGAVSITLEPGGQIELAGATCETLHCTRAELVSHVEELIAVGDEMGVTFVGLGIHPSSTLDQIELVPKQRYQIMAPYMGRVGTLGLRMMKQTATVQANIDYADERDAMRKLAIGMRLAPVMNAMFSNSCIVEGQPSGRMSYRGHIWTDTDNARCGLLPFAFDDSAAFEHYAAWALEVPMYFVLRDGRYLRELTGMPFRHFLEHGGSGERATMDDWNLHLTTLFPEVRLKSFIEFRSTDGQRPAMVLALPALVKGIFYEPDCQQAAWDLVRTWTLDQVSEALDDASRYGLQGRVRNVGLCEMAHEISQIAVEGLRRQAGLDDAGRDERVYIEPLLAHVADRRSPAQHTAERWEGEWRRDVRRLVDDAALTQDSLAPLNF